MTKWNSDPLLGAIKEVSASVTPGDLLLCAPSTLYAAAVCPRCGGDHPHAQCPQVRAVEYDGKGRLRRVEYFESTGGAAVGADGDFRRDVEV